MMDISFIWSSCTKQSTNMKILCSLIIGGSDHARNFSKYFYEHLEKDLKDLSDLTGEKFEDVIFTIHLIIKSLMETSKEICN